VNDQAEVTTKEAIERLDSMQSQIIHGKRIFGDISDVIRLQQKSSEAWKDFAQHQEVCARCADAVSDCEIGSELKRTASELEASNNA